MTLSILNKIYSKKRKEEAEGELPVESNSILESPSKLEMKIETNHSRKQVQVNLDSIALLKNDLTLIIDKPLTNIFNNAVYVGIVDPWKRLCCFQYDVKLFFM